MSKKSDKADHDFAEAMIPHHEEAIRLAKEVISNGSDPDIENLADDIIKAQTSEITFLKKWLAENK